MRKKIALLVAVLVLSAVQAGPGAAWMRRGGSTYQGGHWGAAAGGGHWAAGANGHYGSGTYGATSNGTHYATGSYGGTVATNNGHYAATSNGQYAYGNHYSGNSGYVGAYHPPAVVNQYYRTGCYNCGGWSGAAVAGAANASGVGDVYAALPGRCSYAPYGGGANYDCEGTWFAAAYGANGVYYRVVPAL